MTRRGGRQVRWRERGRLEEKMCGAEAGERRGVRRRRRNPAEAGGTRRLTRKRDARQVQDRGRDGWSGGAVRDQSRSGRGRVQDHQVGTGAAGVVRGGTGGIVEMVRIGIAGLDRRGAARGGSGLHGDVSVRPQAEDRAGTTETAREQDARQGEAGETRRDPGGAAHSYHDSRLSKRSDEVNGVRSRGLGGTACVGLPFRPL